MRWTTFYLTSLGMTDFVLRIILNCKKVFAINSQVQYEWGVSGKGRVACGAFGRMCSSSPNLTRLALK